jgi:hypothetical protein
MSIRSQDQIMAGRPIGGRATGPGRCCPHHPQITLDGGPVLFRCEPYGHSVFAADISHEFALGNDPEHGGRHDLRWGTSYPKT